MNNINDVPAKGEVSDEKLQRIDMELLSIPRNGVLSFYGNDHVVINLNSLVMYHRSSFNVSNVKKLTILTMNTQLYGFGGISGMKQYGDKCGTNVELHLGKILSKDVGGHGVPAGFRIHNLGYQEGRGGDVIIRGDFLPESDLKRFSIVNLGGRVGNGEAQQGYVDIKIDGLDPRYVNVQKPRTYPLVASPNFIGVDDEMELPDWMQEPLRDPPVTD